MGVVTPVVGPNPSASGSPSNAGQYGRKYQLLVTTANGQQVIKLTDSAFEPEALRITFDVYTPCIHSAYWYADIDIYNLDQSTSEQLLLAASNIAQGSNVTLYAGYNNGNYDVIWDGPVFQALIERDNVVDLKLTLHCIFSIAAAVAGQIVSGQYSAGQNQAELITQMLGQIGLHPDYISPNLSKQSLSRGGVFFGAPDKYFTQIAESNNMVWFLNKRGFSIGALNDGLGGGAATTAGFVYSPTTGLLGTPQQTQAGVNFSVLLDPRLKAQIPLLTVGISQALIQQYKKQIGEVIYPLDQDGTYVAGAIRHRGDSRGSVWQTDITGYVKIGDVLSLLGPGNNANINN